MNKKGITYTAIVSLILALMLFFSAAKCGSKFLKLSDESLTSFQDLKENIGSLRNGETKSMTFSISKSNALIGFSKTAEKVEQDSQSGRVDSYFKRPNSCEVGKACLCICTEDWEIEGIGAASNQEIICSKIVCDSFNNIDFSSNIESKNYQTTPNFDYQFRGGFMFQRYPANPHIPEVETQKTEIFLEKQNDVVGICLSPKCI